MKKIIALFITVIVAVCLYGVSKNQYIFSNILASSKTVITENEDRRVETAKTFDEISYKYEAVIKEIKEGYEQQSDSIKLRSCKITVDELAKIIAYLNENGCYYVDSAYTYYTDGKYVSSFNPKYTAELKDIEKYNQEINYVIDKVVKEASSFKTDIEKLIYIHNYLIENIEYDSDSHNNNIYGALVLHKTMCVGYSQAFRQIAEKTGFKTYIVSSSSLQHAWNMVNIKGNYFFVDCTWDDPVFDELKLSDDPLSGYGCYQYFMCSEKQFAENEHNANDYVVNGESVMGIVTDTVYDDFVWRDYQSLMKYSNGSWYHDYGYSGDNINSSRDVKFSIDEITFLGNKNYDKKTVRTIKTCWKTGIEYYIIFESTLQNIDDFIYYFTADGIYRLESKGRFNGKSDLIVFENPTQKNIFDFVVDTENGKFTVIYGSNYDYTEKNAVTETYNIADYFCKAQEHQYVLHDEGEETGEKVYICTACHNVMKEIS